MSSTLRSVLRPLSAVFLAAAMLMPLACHKAAAPVEVPEPFTGQLPEVDGVQAIVSLRHPKLVNDDLGKLMAGVPETALARMMLSQYAAFGYPDFTEITAGSNIGVALLSLSAADLKAKNTVAIGFAKLKEGGKLWGLLVAQGMVMQKHGDWVLIAKDDASLAKLKSPDAVAAYLEQPQAEDLRLWGRLTPEFLAGIKDQVATGIDGDGNTLSAEQKKAAHAYCDVLFTLLGEIHSADISLAFADEGIHLDYGLQALPDTPLGIYLRYKPSPAPAIASYFSGDSLAAMSFHNNPQAVVVLFDSILDPLIAVDYPPAAGPLKDFKTSVDAQMALNSGQGVAAFDLAVGPKDGRDQVQPEFVFVNSGTFTPESVRNYLKSTRAVTDEFTQLMQAQGKKTPGVNVSTTIAPYVENAVTIQGCVFDSWTTTVAMNGKTLSTRTDFGGVVDGSLVMASSEDALKARVPALLAKVALPDALPVPAIPGEVGHGQINGGKLVDLMVAAAKLDLTDSDTKAQVDGLKAAYGTDAPVSFSVIFGQAKVSENTVVPYKFIEGTIHLGQYLSARKFNLLSLFAPGAPPRARPMRPARPPVTTPPVLLPDGQ
jgi:hypothetical protein